MLKKTITFDDLDGNPVTQDFYFNLTPQELAEMEFSVEGGMIGLLERIVEEKNSKVILDMFKEILSKAYGVRGADNIQFIKAPELWIHFTQTDAFSKLFLEMMSDANYAAEFFNGLMPKELQEKAKELDLRPIDHNAAVLPPTQEPAKDPEPWVTEDRDMTGEEMMRATQPQLVAAMKRKNERMMAAQREARQNG